MNSLRVRFAIGFCTLFTILFTVSLTIVYIFYADFRKDEFYSRLKDRAITTFNLLIQVEQIDNELLKVINKNTLNSLYDEKVLIFDNDTLLYSSIDDKPIPYNQQLLNTIHQKQEVTITRGNDEIIGFTIDHGEHHFILMAAAFDKYGKRKMEFLKWILVGVYVGGVLLGWSATWYFVKKVIRPLEHLKNNIQNVNYNNLDKRLPETGQGKEVDNLASNFNKMLGRLQQSISFQKDFIHYASHELRTPLASMVSITQNAMKETGSEDPSQQVFAQLFQQQKHLTDITTSLLLLSDSNTTSSSSQYPELRLDELIFRSVEISNNLFPDATIDVSLEGQLTMEEYLLIRANEPLLLMLFNNLIKNAWQYSPDQAVHITILLSDNTREVHFSNKGAMLSPEEKDKIFTPFYRAGNAVHVKGAGLGLPLVKAIADLHKASLQYNYIDGNNVFSIFFPVEK